MLSVFDLIYFLNDHHEPNFFYFRNYFNFEYFQVAGDWFEVPSPTRTPFYFVTPGDIHMHLLQYVQAWGWGVGGCLAYVKNAAP
jgi:hypothetical protein